ncbi:hypothetical protein V2A60_003515 [Cordyceps javanica]
MDFQSGPPPYPHSTGFCETCHETRCLLSQLHGQLDEWVDELEEQMPHLVGVATAEDGRTALSKPAFRNPGETQALAQYWVMRLAIYLTTWRLSKMPSDACRAGVAEDVRRRDETYIGAVRAALRTAAYCMGPGTGSWHREMWVELSDDMKLFCDKRGGLGEIQEKVLRLQEDVNSGWEAHRLTRALVNEGDDRYFV